MRVWVDPKVNDEPSGEEANVSKTKFPIDSVPPVQFKCDGVLPVSNWNVVSVPLDSVSDPLEPMVSIWPTVSVCVESSESVPPSGPDGPIVKLPLYISSVPP